MTDKTATPTASETPAPVTEETAAAKTIEAKSPPASKSELLAKLASLAAGMSIEHLTDQVAFFNKSIAQIGHEADVIKAGESEKNKNSIKMKPSDASSAVKEDLAQVLEGVGTEDFRIRMTAIYEAALNLRVTTETAKIEEAYDAKLAEAIAEHETKLQEQINLYLSEAAQSWADENKVAIESSLKVEMVENFLEGLFNLGREHNIDLPKEKVDVVEALTDRVNELTAKLEEATKTQAAMSESVQALKAEKVFNDISEGLTLLEVEKFKVLAETVDVTDLDVLRKSLVAIRETHFKADAPKPSATPGVVAEEVVTIIRDGEKIPEATATPKTPVNEDNVLKINPRSLDGVFGRGAGLI